MIWGGKIKLRIGSAPDRMLHARKGRTRT